jgi:luciferase family oxidoreductase group 1
VLDLSPVSAGESSRDALLHTVDLAQRAEALGYRRYWVAEHHNAGGIACSSPEVLVATIASATQRLRVGSGGVMLPNHSALRVAETFRVLEALHPGRIDLGVGRAPGTDKRTALLLRRAPELLAEGGFEAQLDELLRFLGPDPDPTVPFNAVKAVPIGVPSPEVWLLGASLASARGAGERGLAYAYAHHFAPDGVAAALDVYRASFRPSASWSSPRAVVATAVVCAPTDAEAEDLATSGGLSFLRAGRGLRDLPLASVSEAKAYAYDEDERALLAHARGRAFVGGRERVAGALSDLVSTSGADELLLTTMVHDHAARVRSYELVAEAASLK